MRTVHFDGVRWSMDRDGAWLCLKVLDREAAQAACEDMTEGKRYVAEIKRFRRKRSLDANAYAWVLIGKLAAHYGISTGDIYRHNIREIGGVYTVIAAPAAMVKRVSESWCAGHIGRMVDDMGPSAEQQGWNNLRLWIGSSDYDGKQMHDLLEQLQQECRLVGIETKTPEELASLLNEWRAKA